MTHQTKKIVLASITVIIATGLLALNPSIIGYAQGQMYGNYEYGYDNNYPKKSSPGDIQKINCVNSNINVNGIDITKIPEDTTATAAANEGIEAADASNSQNGNDFDKINFDRNLVNICVNVNDNEQQVSPPETTLTVAKKIVCTDEIEGDCEDLLSTTIDESDFLFQVTGNNPNPSEQFPSSTSGTVVTLDPGDYQVIEDFGQYITDIIAWLQSPDHNDPPRQAALIVSYTGDCDEDSGGFITRGTIAAGQTQTCTATNSITIKEVTCDECFTRNLNDDDQASLLTAISGLTSGQITTFEQLCEEFSEAVAAGDEDTLQQLSNLLENAFNQAQLTDQFNTVFDCLNDVFNDAIPPPTIV